MHFTTENGDKTKKIEAGVGVEYIIQTEKTIRDFSESKTESFLYQQQRENVSDIPGKTLAETDNIGYH